MTYIEIAEKIEEAIQQGHVRPGVKLSAREIARDYEVSFVTGNRALNLLAERELVIRKPRGGSYVDNRRKQCRLIGYSIEHFQQNVFNQTAGVFREILLDEFRRRNFKLRMLSPGDWQPEWLGDLDALLFTHDIDEKLQQVALHLGIPVLQFYGERIWDHPFHQVVIDLESGFRELFRHVSPERFRRAVIVTGDDETLARAPDWPAVSSAKRDSVTTKSKPSSPTTFCPNATGRSGRSSVNAAATVSSSPAATTSLRG